MGGNPEWYEKLIRFRGLTQPKLFYARAYGTPAIFHATSAALIFLYFSEWKVTNSYIPFYGSSRRFTDPPLW